MATASYFDGLIADPILHVLRRSRSFGEDARFVSQLLHPANPITGADHLLFSSLTLRVHHPVNTRSLPRTNTHLKDIEIRIWGRQCPLMLQFFARFGRNLRNISIDRTNPDVPFAITSAYIYHAIHQFCGQANGEIPLSTLGLSMNTTLPPFIVYQLTSLINRSKSHLRRLKLQGKLPGPTYTDRFFSAVRSCEGLKEIILNGVISQGSEGIWRYIGLGLEVLWMDHGITVDDHTWTSIIGNIIVNCPKLQKVHFGTIFPRSGNNTTYRSFLQVYNEHLLHAPYTRLSLPDLVFFVRTCPNNRVCWPLRGNIEASRFRILCPVLETILLTPDAANIGVLAARDPGILSTCSELLFLTIRGQALFGVKHLFGSAVLRQIRELRLFSCTTSLQLVEIVEHHVPNLIVLECEVTDPYPSQHFLRPLITTSMSRLQQVRIIEPPFDLPGFLLDDVPDDRYVGMIGGFVDVFSNAKKLKSLCMGTRSSNCDPRVFRHAVRLLTKSGVLCSLETADWEQVNVPDYKSF